MTAYVAFAQAANGSAPVVGLKPVTYPIRIARLDCQAYGVVSFGFYHKFASTISGGTLITPLPLRGGAPASTATCRSGLAASVETGATVIATTTAGSQHSIGTDAGGNPELTGDAGSSSYTFPFDYIVAVGDVFLSSINTTAGSGSLIPATTGYITIYYEELRLSWSF